MYDEDRKPLLKQQVRGMPIPKGCYHIVVDVWTLNRQGEFLLTQRHPSKKYGLLWECTGGSILTGEDSITGVLRELKEETGICALAEDLTLLHSIRLEERFVDTYITVQDIKLEDLKLQEEEVVGARFVSFKELSDMWEKGLVVPRERIRMYKDKLELYKNTHIKQEM